MCCERERLTREYQRLYKSYEVDPDTRAVDSTCLFLFNLLERRFYFPA